MLKQLQRKLINCDFITNDISDKRSRFEINSFLKQILLEHDSQKVMETINYFVKGYKLRNGNSIQNKAAYFIAAINQELSTPDVSFELEPITEEVIKVTIARLIEICITLKAPGEDWQNPLMLQANPSLYILDEHFKAAMQELHANRELYSPIINEFIELHELQDDQENSIASKIKDLYLKLGFQI